MLTILMYTLPDELGTMMTEFAHEHECRLLAFHGTRDNGVYVDPADPLRIQSIRQLFLTPTLKEGKKSTNINSIRPADWGWVQGERTI